MKDVSKLQDSTLPEFIGKPNFEETYNWNYKDINYVLLSYDKGCKAWCKKEGEKYFSPAVIFEPLILPSYTKVQLLDKNEFKISEFYYEYKSYIDSIPWNVKLLIGELGRYQYLALEAIYYIDGFKDFLKQEKKTQSLNYIISVWSLANAKELPLLKRIELTKEAMYTERSKMLSILIGLKCKKRFLNIINKFPPADIDRPLISKLYYFSENDKLYTALINNVVFKKSTINKIYSELPDWLITAEIINALTGLPPYIDSLKSVFPPIILNAEKNRQKEILTILKDVKNYQSMEDKFAALTQKLKLKQVFPPPPFKESKKLEAIKNGFRLKQEGLQMHNCVAGYADYVLRGESYFYHWDDGSGEPATVQVNIEEDYNYWYLEEALGFNNEKLTRKAIFNIKKELLNLSPDKKLPLGVCEVAGAFYYELQNKWDEINEGCKIVLQREPENEYDVLAIIVFLELNGELFKLGYVPRYRNSEFAKLMDKKQELKAEIVHKDENGSYKDLEIMISLTAPLVEI